MKKIYLDYFWFGPSGKRKLTDSESGPYISRLLPRLSKQQVTQLVINIFLSDVTVVLIESQNPYYPNNYMSIM